VNESRHISEGFRILLGAAHCLGVITTELLLLAARQHGAFSHRQLIQELGISQPTVSRARRKGLMVEVLPGIARLASSPETFLTRCMAVQLKTEDDGFLSGWTAARLADLRGMPENKIHFTVPDGFRTRMPTWVDVHRTRWYNAELDRETRDDGLIVAKPMRMLFGLAAVFNQHRFERAAEDAWHRGLITPQSALEYLEIHRCRGKDGVSTVEQWLEHALGQDRPAQSNLERDLIHAFENAALPHPKRQYPLKLKSGETIHLDIAWPDIKLAVEPGASWWHGGDLGQRKDQSRDRACSELGWSVIRFDESVRDDFDAAALQVVRIHRQWTRDTRNVPQNMR
jgi:very-short-patch-repair endonuclease